MFDAIVLFSGGLDSILAAKVLQAQGLRILGFHASTPFFGNPKAIGQWEKRYDFPIRHCDLSDAFVDMLKEGPPHGFGKHLNPCVDCKILILRAAKACMEEVGAFCLATGEVIGQRPMSQRRDTLHLIAREAMVRDILVRPLCAQHLPETLPETEGRIDRSRLLDFQGRGRNAQLDLARDFDLKDIPTPSGGCHLTEEENTRRYWMLLHSLPSPSAHDFRICNVGRQFWAENGKYWLTIGRNSSDNQKLKSLQRECDCLISFPSIPAPLALAPHSTNWPREWLLTASRTAFSYATKMLQKIKRTRVRIRGAQNFEEEIEACRDERWTVPGWEEVHSDLIAQRKKKASEKAFS